jgi:hypothetical protein
MSPRRKNSSVSTLQIVLAVVVVLGILIALAFLIAPDRPEAPPASTVAYEKRPEAQRPQVDESFETWRPMGGEATSTTTDTPEDAPDLQPHAYTVQGVVLDARTREAVTGARVTATRQSTSEELAAFREEQARVIQAEDSDGLEQLNVASERLRHSRTVTVLADGTFTAPLAVAGEYAVEVQAAGYMTYTGDLVRVDDTQTEAALEILLSTGASVSGTVREAGTSRGAEGIQVIVEDGRQPPATTDADGRYVISGLPPGEYGIQLNLRQTPYRTGETVPFQKILIATPDQTLKNIDFVVEPAGTVWGYVTDPEKQALPGTNVVLCTSESVASQALQAALNQAPPIMGRSDDDGYYELNSVPLNQEWRLLATSDQHAPQLAKPFLLTPTKRDVRVDIFLFAGTTVYGRVVEPSGSPVPGADVFCLPGFTNLFSPLDGPQAFRNTTSDKQGNFVVEELPAGDYQIFGRKGGYKIAATGEPIYPDGHNDLRGVEVVLYPVEDAIHAIYGTVTDRNRQPIAMAKVELDGFGGESMSEATMSTSTNSAGEYRFDGLESGMYAMEVSKEGFAPRTVRNVRLDAPTDVTLVTMALVRGRVLIKGKTEAPPLYTVSARAMESPEGASEGSPFEILAFWDEGTQQQFSNPDGSFELRLQPGRFALEASAEGFVPGRESIVLEASEALENVVIYVSEDGGRIDGTVTTADGKSPAGCTVMLGDASLPLDAFFAMGIQDVPGSKTTRVGADGAFSFESLPPGEYAAFAQLPGYTPGKSDPVYLEEDGEATVEIRLSFGGSLEGYVTVNGEVRPGAVVFAWSEGQPRMVNTDQNGFYSIDRLPPGRIMVTAAPYGVTSLTGMAETRMASVEIIEGQTTTHNFGEEEGATIEGFAAGLPNSMLGGAAALRYPGPASFALGQVVPTTALFSNMNYFNGTSVDSSGFFVIENVPPGAYQIDVFVMPNLFTIRYAGTVYVEVQGVETIPVEVPVEIF